MGDQNFECAALSVRRSRWLFASASVLAHLSILVLITMTPVTPPEPGIKRAPVDVMLVAPPRPEPEPEPPRLPEPDPGPSLAMDPVVTTRSTPPETPPPPVERPVTRRPRPVPANVDTVSVSVVAAPEMATISSAQVAGARTAGSGTGSGGGGAGSGAGTAGAPCDMVERLQAALREDAEIREAVGAVQRGVGGRTVLVWDGDWIQSPGQSGKGLAGVRQAIALEVAFAPAACRAEAMRGMVVVSFSDGPGAPRLAFGRGQWRWSDMLK